MKRKKIIGIAFAAMMAVVAIIPATTAKANVRNWSGTIPALGGEVCNFGSWNHTKDGTYAYGGISAGTINCADCYTLIGWAVNSDGARRSSRATIQQKDWSTVQVIGMVDCGDMKERYEYAPRLKNADSVWHAPTCSGASNWDSGAGL